MWLLSPGACGLALEKVGAHLKEHGPFLGGETPNAADAALAPQLYHAKHALKHFKARPARLSLGSDINREFQPWIKCSWQSAWRFSSVAPSMCS